MPTFNPPQVLVSLTPLDVMPVHSLTTASLGFAICSYGWVSKWRCGKIIGLEAPIEILGRKFSGLRVTTCGTQGDSGGPVFLPDGSAIGLFSAVYQNPCDGSFGGGDQAASYVQDLHSVIQRYPGLTIRSY